MSGAPLPSAPAQYEQSTLDLILQAIEQRLSDLESPNTRDWTLGVDPSSRVFNAATATAAQTTAALGSLLNDLKTSGRIR
jgi:hypothetical protein